MAFDHSNPPKGVQRTTKLPDAGLGELWQSIIVDQKTKDQLLAQAIVNFTVRPKVARSVLPLHGTILLVGLPGTGKTSLAKGLASEVAKVFDKSGFKLLEIDPHALGSAMMGKTQKAVSDLFSQSIAEAAMAGPTIVLLDEVETLAADRSKLSLQANPVDVHRATDAVLVQLDALAETHPNLLFVATSNFPQAVDSAFTSRCDLVLEIPLPNREACEQILTDCLKGLAQRGLRTSLPNSPWHGRHSRLRRSPHSGRTASGWCVASRGIAARTIRVQPCRRRTCFPTVIVVPSPTSIATRRSPSRPRSGSSCAHRPARATY